MPSLSYAEVLDIARTIPELAVDDWSHIWRVYTYPGKGVMTVRTTRGVMAQLDAQNGKILDVSARSEDFWEDVHEGIFGRHRLQGGNPFGGVNINLALFVFLPVNVLATILWFTGVYWFLKGTVVKRATPRRVESTDAVPATSSPADVGSRVPLPDLR